MTKSANILSNYRTESESSTGAAISVWQRIPRRTALLMVFVLLALAAYCTPWMHSGSMSLSLTGYDLAEWTSLVPGVRYGENPMVVPGLLRAQLMFIAVIVALLPLKRGSAFWWICAACALLLVGAQLPPFEYFLEESWRSDVNYGQQVTLAVLTLFNVMICLAVPRGWPRKIALIVMAAAGIFTALAGASEALNLASGYAIPLAMGGGVFGYGAALAGIALIALLPHKLAVHR